ncbi:MBL fold metallo-hydrolase [Streptomyces hyaluromycini]|uniref:MBL fold metallo-hydrolase n=1 Tax=Streptomyces hyaluromycini TaxID=1377993 RepID=UPI000B5CD3CD|nr:MBL fold metallo-hydrolase [Streptomyces hyaluromycini]
MSQSRPRSARPGAGPEVAPGVVRLGDPLVNFYLVDHPDGLTLVDAGLPGQRGRLLDHLAAAGRSPADIRAVLITHAHPDHIGLTAELQQAGAEVWVHEDDRVMLTDGPRKAMRHARSERSPLPYLVRRPAALAAMVSMARQGAFTAPPPARARTFGHGARLDGVPGRPLAVALPGHTPGSTGFHFPDQGLFFTGDALVTQEAFTGHTGPCLVCRAFTHDSAAALASLDAISGLSQDTVLLPGHGQPFDGGPREAVARARSFGVR